MKHRHKNNNLNKVLSKCESLSFGPTIRLYVATEDTYAGAEYISILSSIYKLKKNIKIIPIKNTQLIGGTSPDKLLIYICTFRNYLSKDGFTNFNKANQDLLSYCTSLGLKTRNTIINQFSEDNYESYFCDIESMGIPRSISNDIFYICCDVDNISIKTFGKCEKLAKKYNIKMLISNISIETWFLLHFKENAKEPTTVEDTIILLEQEFKALGANKTYMKIIKYKDNKGITRERKKKSLSGLESFFTREKIENAKNKVKRDHIKYDNTPVVPRNPGSTMYKLLDDINSL